MTNQRYVIGVDCGSTMVKAAIIDLNGKELAVAVEKVDHLYLHPGWTENNAELLWENVCSVLRQLFRCSSIDPQAIACLACTGYGNGLYLTDETGRPVRNGIISSDVRAREYIERWTTEKVLDKIRPKTMQSIWAAQPNALFRWLMDYEPETLDKAKWFFSCKDYVRFRLTGVPCFELSDATGTSLLNVQTNSYDDEVLDAWGLMSIKHLLPPLCRSFDFCGTVTRESAQRTGLAEGTPVAGGMFDIDACGLASGMVDEEQICLVAGTWGNNLSLTKNPVVSNHIFMTSRYCIDDYYLMLEGSPTSASNFEWFVANFYEQNRSLFAGHLTNANPQAHEGNRVDQSNSESTSIDFYRYCLDLIAKSNVRDSNLVFLPYLFGSPVDLDAKGVLFGLDGRHRQEHILRAVLEGTVFGHLWHVERLLEFRNMSQTIRLTGGATKSPSWTQMFADVFQVPVEVPEGTELGVLGAAICAAVAVGLHDSYQQARESMVRFHQVYSPCPATGEIYQRKYHRFRELLRVLQGHWTLNDSVPNY